MTNLLVHTDREDVSAKFNLSGFVTDWEAARKTFIACIADAFQEPLNPRPEDFSTAFPTELGEAWCKYRIFGGASTIVLRADSLSLNFPNILRPDYTIVADILRRCADILLPKLASYEEHSYNLSSNQHASVIHGQSEDYLARHASTNIENPASESAMEYRPCIGFTLRTSDGYRVLRRTIEQSEALANGLFIADHVFVKIPKLTRFDEELRSLMHIYNMANRLAGIAEQEEHGDDAVRP